MTPPTHTYAHACRPAPRPGHRRLRLMLALAWATVFVTVFTLASTSDVTAEQAAAAVRAAGAWGVAAFLAAYTFLQPLGLSGHLLTVAAAVVWPPWLAFALSLVGSVGAAVVMYVVGRFVAFRWVQDHMPARLRRFETWLVRHGLVGVIGFRTFTFTLVPACLMIGTLRVRFGTMLIGTAIGFIPAVVIDVFLGDLLGQWLGTG